jgi:ABC-type polysaccharide/polyol phosphate export permease
MQRISFSNELLRNPLSNPTLWQTLGWLDIVQSYRRSLLGPIWITLNMVIFSVCMTLVYGTIFGVSTAEYGAYVISAMICWTWIAALVVDVGNTFIVHSNYIKGMVIDKSQLIWATAYKQIIVLAHNMIVYVFAVIFGVIDFTFYSLLFIPCAALFFLMTIPLIAMLAILFARYRDIPRLAQSITIILMLLTPIFWMPTMMKGWRSLIFELNPLYYFIEFLRRPLMGAPPDATIVMVFLSITALLWLLGSFFYRRYHRYVAFWV